VQASLVLVLESIFEADLHPIDVETITKADASKVIDLLKAEADPVPAERRKPEPVSASDSEPF